MAEYEQMDEHKHKQKRKRKGKRKQPTLYLMKAEKNFSAADLAKLHKALTCKDSTPEEIREAQKILDEERG
jgi:hypothetical protein